MKQSESGLSFPTHSSNCQLELFWKKEKKTNQEMGKKKSVPSSSPSPRYHWCGPPSSSSSSGPNDEIMYTSLEIEDNNNSTATKRRILLTIGDCISLVSENQSKPYIGKICKMYEKQSQDRNQQMIVTKWFYRPGTPLPSLS